MEPSEVVKKFGIGLTGGTACGKSTVASYLQQLGYTVIDADRLAREAVSPNSRGLAKIVEKFGGSILTEQGVLNRKLMADLIFSDPDKKRQLEEIIHPIIHDLLEKKLIETGLVASPRFWFYEATLLFETGAAHKFRQVWSVNCPKELQLTRLMKRDKRSRSMAEKILNAQLPAKDKASRADIVIDTSANISELYAKIRVALEHLPPC